MQVEQVQWLNNRWEPGTLGKLRQAQLVLLFGSRALLRLRDPYCQLHEAYPAAHILGCSTAGEIAQTSVYDGTLVATALQFEYTALHGLRLRLKDGMSSREAGEILARHLDKTDLVHVFVISNGVSVNGSALVNGLAAHLPPHIGVTGGLAGDGDRFEETLVLWEGQPEAKSVVVIGFYGKQLRVGYGSLGGWDPFGPQRLVTRSHENVLYELDGKPALSLYKTYLGEHAQDLPAAGLLFPLYLHTPDNGEPVVRTLLGVNEHERSMTFAGDLPEGAYIRFMRANFDRLIEGAVEAARLCRQPGETPPQLAILISCVGRKLVLQQRVHEEVQGVRRILGPDTPFTGFYSYGEISPFTPGEVCSLHNQTMTVTTFSEEKVAQAAVPAAEATLQAGAS